MRSAGSAERELTMIVYSDEDNMPMRDERQIEYTGVINDRLFRETGECVVKKAVRE